MLRFDCSKGGYRKKNKVLPFIYIHLIIFRHIRLHILRPSYNIVEKLIIHSCDDRLVDATSRSLADSVSITNQLVVGVVGQNTKFVPSVSKLDFDRNYVEGSLLFSSPKIVKSPMRCKCVRESHSPTRYLFTP